MAWKHGDMRSRTLGDLMMVVVVMKTYYDLIYNENGNDDDMHGVI